ncbi:MAG: hypothetical protein ACW97P_03325 [Candidatus Hodarchaeales archaeon]|jgi:hypothetical protein
MSDKATLIDQIIRQLNGDIDEDDKLVTECGILGVGYLFCYQPSTRSFVRIYKQQKVFILGHVEGKNKFLIYTSCGRIVEIDTDKIYTTNFD